VIVPSIITLNLAQIARLADVSPSAVSQWRKRYEDFPKALGEGVFGATFSYAEVKDWLIRNDKPFKEEPLDVVHYSLTTLRANWGSTQITDYVVSCLLVIKAMSRPSESNVSSKNLLEMKAEIDPDGTRFLEAIDSMLQYLPLPKNLSEGLSFQRLDEENAPPQSSLYFVFKVILNAVTSGIAPIAIFEFITDWRASMDRFEGQSPDVLCELIAGIVPFEPKTILDPAVGTGKLLSRVSNSTSRQRVVGWDINREAIWYARARFLLSDQPDFTCLEQSAFPTLESEAQNFDLVVCEPPLGLRIQSELSEINSKYWPFGLPSPSSADFAWLQIAWNQLKPGGHAIVLLAVGTLLQDGRSAVIRREMFESGVVEAIVRLPQKLLANTNIQTCLWIIGKPTQKSDSSVLLIDLTEKVEVGKSKNNIQPQFLGETQSQIKSWLESRSHTSTYSYAKVVETKQILELGLAHQFNSLYSEDVPSKKDLEQKASMITQELIKNLDSVQMALNQLQHWEHTTRQRRKGNQ